MPKTRRVNFRQHIGRWGFPVLGVLLFAASLWSIDHQLKQYPYQEVINNLKALPRQCISTALVLTSLSYLALTIYDILACRYIRHSISPLKVILAAFIGHAISNSVGFAVVTGGAVRYRLYSAWGLSTVEIAQVIGLGNLSFWLGLFAVGGIVFLLEPLAIPTLVHLPFASAHPLGLIFLALVGSYLLGSLWVKQPLRIRKWQISLPSHWFALAQLAVAALDWALAGGVLYVLLQPSITLSYSSFFGIYLLAQVAGFISHVPGGLGVFESFVLWFLSPRFPATKVFGTLLAYRGIYYLLPLIIALLLLGVYEIYQRLKARCNHNRMP
jgi:uncharacterized membrane protein YbhN (UPF0104 family)